MKYKPHPAQEKFINDPSPRMLWIGGLPTRGHYDWVMKRFLEKSKDMTEMEIALLTALVKLIDGYITPLQTRIKCWKTKKYSTGNDIDFDAFELGMINPQFDGTEEVLYWFVPIKHWNKFNVIELDKAPESKIHDDKQLIEALYKL